ncbi:MAG: ParB/RepB/Spo0J family partition protein [Panacagrimonas sp.]
MNPASSDVRMLSILAILIDPEHQARKRGEDEAKVRRITRELRNGGTIREPVLVEDGFDRYVLRDGFHRVKACIAAGVTTIAARMLPSNPMDAFGTVMSANTAHGKEWSRNDAVQSIVQGLRDGIFRDRDEFNGSAPAIPWSISKLAREFCTVMACTPDAARKAIERAAKSAAKDDPRVADELAQIKACHQPECETESDARPSIEEMNRARLTGVEREAIDIARMLAAKLGKLPKTMRKGPMQPLLHMLR